jgi:hypothetical protein
LALSGATPRMRRFDALEGRAETRRVRDADATGPKMRAVAACMVSVGVGRRSGR